MTPASAHIRPRPLLPLWLTALVGTRLPCGAAPVGDLQSPAAPMAVCRALSGTLQDNAPFPHVLDAFGQLHQQLVVLSAAVQQTCGAGVLAADGLAFHTVASVLFTVYSRVGDRPWRSITGGVD